MKKPVSLFIVLASLALASCNNATSSSTSSENASYEVATHYLSAASLINAASNGVSSFFIMTSLSCGHCQTFAPTFIKALQKCQKEISLLEYSTDTSALYTSNLTLLQNTYGKVLESGGVDGATPRIYHLDSNGCSYLDFYNDTNTVSQFVSYLNNLTFNTEIYHFADYSKYSSSASSEVLSYLYDARDEASANFYFETLYPLAQKAKKKLFLLDYESMNEENRTLYLNALSLKEYTPTLFLKGESLSVKGDLSSSQKKVASYYEGATTQTSTLSPIDRNGDLL